VCPCLACCKVCIMPRHTLLGHSVMQLMVPRSLRLTTARGQTKGHYDGYPTTHPTTNTIPPHKVYPCSACCAIRIMPHHTSLGHSVTWLMVPGGLRPMTARGQSKGRHVVGPTTHPTIKVPPSPKGYRCLPRHAIQIQPHHT
jgi:hypothetical protein